MKHPNFAEQNDRHSGPGSFQYIGSQRLEQRFNILPGDIATGGSLIDSP